jgi:hypothetical protein
MTEILFVSLAKNCYLLEKRRKFEQKMLTDLSLNLCSSQAINLDYIPVTVLTGVPNSLHLMS